MGKSTYVKTFAIIFLVYCSLGFIASVVGLFYVNYLPSLFVEKGTEIPSGVYPALYSVLGLLAFHYLLLLFISTCLLVLNKKESNTTKAPKKIK
jgi:hypothetical protein